MIELTRENVILEARTWLGTKWKHQGRLKVKGCDCVGFIIGVIKVFVPDLWGYKDTHDYAHNANIMELIRPLDKYFYKKMITDLKPADIMVFPPTHTGFFTDIGFIHSYAMAGRKVTEHRLSDDWKEKIVRVYGIPGIKD